jgi:hypothetical protein
VKRTVRVWVRADETPNAIPDAAAAHNPDAPGAEPGRPSATRTTAVAASSAIMAVPPSAPISTGRTSVSSPTRPSTVRPMPCHSSAVTARRARIAASGTASTRVSTPNGCTSESGANGSEPTCSSPPTPLRAREAHHIGVRSSSRRGRPAVRSCSTAATAYASDDATHNAIATASNMRKP